MTEEYHIPVLYQEVIDNLIKDKNGVYVDCTLGGGGHSEGILENIDGNLIAMDQDDQAIEFASKRLEKFSGRFQIFRDNFKNIETVIYMAGYNKVDGILMDIGVSSKQLDDPKRGFSYRFDEKLDMRMDRRQEKSAYHVVNEYSEEKLAKIIYEYGEDRFAKKIARTIVEKRAEKKIETTDDLVKVIHGAVRTKSVRQNAKRVFQAIRIEVNDELEVLKETIEIAVDLLKKGGRLAIITFHSLEDRIVKEKFRELAKGCICPPDFPICACDKESIVKIITKKPIVSTEGELKSNSRAQSAKLRLVERL